MLAVMPVQVSDTTMMLAGTEADKQKKITERLFNKKTSFNSKNPGSPFKGLLLLTFQVLYNCKPNI